MNYKDMDIICEACGQDRKKGLNNEINEYVHYL